MDYVIRIGYERKGDGSVVPVCDPPVGSLHFQLMVWKPAVKLAGDRYLVTVRREGTTVEGNLEPNAVAEHIGRMADSARTVLVRVLAEETCGFPFEEAAAAVVRQAGPRLVLRPLVEIRVHPSDSDREYKLEDLIRVSASGPTTVVHVVGHPESNPWHHVIGAIIADELSNRIVDALPLPRVDGEA